MDVGTVAGTDSLSISGLKVSTVIGVRAWERQLRQRLIIDLDIEIDAARGAASDALDDAVDYGAVARRVIAFAEASSFNLIETIAEEVAALLLREFPISGISIGVSKPDAIPDAETVTVRLYRSA